jgi:mono/diheme cytochrome c family protein
MQSVPICSLCAGMAARFKILFASLLVAALFPPETTFSAASVDVERLNFGRDILPILSDNCYQCHGPDEQARKAKLRFDTKEGAFRIKDGKAVIAPGKSSESELIRRITSTDPDDVMPPPKSNRRLTGQQIDLLKRWIDQGAIWSKHWSFEPPQQPEIPKTKNKHWVENPIDAFVLARLEKEKLKASPEANKETLLRRITLDLTGLPPTLAELDAFLADKSPNAYGKVVDRLLASPRYGERMAVDWLDIARFADTHGYQMDRYRAMWPYRDWVIKAFNQNLSYDKFILWQLAGDLLPNPTKEQRLATAFNRLHCQNEEGGIVEEEYRVAYVVDRVNTIGTAFLGLTLECSRCHDHKFDPITQRDYYSLFAFFQNIDESGQTSYFTDSMPVPTLLLSDDVTDTKLALLKNEIAEKEQQLAALRETTHDSFTQWLTTNTHAVEISGLVASFSFDEITANKITNAVNPSKLGNAVENPKLVPGKSGQCVELSGENGFTFPSIGHFNRTDPFSISLWLQTPSYAPRAVILHHSKAPIDAGSRGYELLLENGHVVFGLHHMWPGNSLKVATKDPIASNQWTQVSITYDGSSRANGVHIYLNGNPVPCETIRDGLFKDIAYENGEPELAIGYRFRDNGFRGGHVDDFKLFNRALTPLEVSQLARRTNSSDGINIASAKLTATQRDELFDFYFATVCAPALKISDELHQLRQEQNRLINPIPEVMVMQEMPQPKPAYILKRGAYDSHGEQVSANTPASLPSFPAGEQRNRLGLTHWLLSSENPLTARVTVNRAWQMMFGRGIVETSDNFGKQGTFPTHPELLDWLACEFRDNGWDMKHLVKLIAMSSTYRQSSSCSPELLARDPANELLARGPARRLTAEMLRDQALAVSGLLVEKIGGPSVKPYQPDGLWEEKAMGAPHYDQGHGDDLHRRSLYTFWKRTVPPPAMIAFDSSEKNICTVRRQSTSTPLQSLALLNDTQILEAARHVSQRMLKEGGTNLENQVSWTFRLITNRRPTSKETKLLKALYEEQRDIFAADKASAEKLLAVGEAKNDPNLNTAALAAGTVLAEAILNHDAAVMRR